MTAGLSTTNTADKLLNSVAGVGTTFTAGSVYVKLHTADPGSTGATAAATGNTTRVAATFTASSGGTKSLASMASTWAITLSGLTTESISHISLWDAATAGNFLWSIGLTTPKTVGNGDTLSLTSLTLSFAPLAA